MADATKTDNIVMFDADAETHVPTVNGFIRFITVNCSAFTGAGVLNLRRGTADSGPILWSTVITAVGSSNQSVEIPVTTSGLHLEVASGTFTFQVFAYKA